jgi:gluconokinase
MDLGTASTTGLFDLDTYDWDPEILDRSLVLSQRLPDICASDDQVGTISAAATVATGLPEGLPVVAGSSDGGLAILGMGAQDLGQEIITVGTSGAVRRVTPWPTLHPQAQTWCYLLYPNRCFAGGAINNAGLAVKWVLQNYYPEAVSQSDNSRLFQEAASIPPGSDGLLFLPYFTGERSPHWNPSVRAQIFGLGIHHTRAHIARAVLEGVGFCLADVRQALNQVDLPVVSPGKKLTRLTGSIVHSPAWVQILANILDQPMILTKELEASAYGAGLCAFAALMESPIDETIRRIGTQTSTIQVNPEPQAVDRYRTIHAQFQELYHQANWPGR